MPRIGQPPVHTHGGNGVGGQLDWDDVWSDAVHSHASTAEGGTVGHGDLSGVTSDQHHAQAHASRHAITGADPLAVMHSSQAAGDLIQAASASLLQRLGIGATDDILTVLSGLAAWAKRDAVAILTLTFPGGNWLTSVTGSGSYTNTLGRLSASSGTTASSNSRVSTGTLTCLSPGQAQWILDWAKRCVLRFNFTVINATTNGISRAQWGRSGDVNDLANLDAKGIGIRIDNLALKGLAHNGTSLRVVNLNTTLVAGTTYRMRIVSDGAGNVEWFLDGVSKGTSAAGPSSAGSLPNTSIQITAENGADAVQVQFDLSLPTIDVYQ